MIQVIKMPFVRRYKDMNTDLNALYKGIVKFMQDDKELNVSQEFDGEINNTPFMSITAVRANIPRSLMGTLREVTVTITGKSNDFLIEAHAGAWLSNMIVPGTGGFLVAGPFGAVAGASATAVIAVNYARVLKNKIKDLVQKHSKGYSAEKIETFN